MTKKELIAKAKKILEKNGEVKMVSKCGDYCLCNKMFKVHQEIEIWEGDERYEVVDAIA